MNLSAWVRGLGGRQDGSQRMPLPFSENARAGKHNSPVKSSLDFIQQGRGKL